MGDEHGTANESDNLAATVGDTPVSAVVPPGPVVQAPRPVSLPPRPGFGSTTPLSRPAGTPPPPPVRNSVPVSRPSYPAPPAAPRSPAPPPDAAIGARPPPPSMRPAPPSMRALPPQPAAGYAGMRLPPPSMRPAMPSDSRSPQTVPGGVPSLSSGIPSTVAVPSAALAGQAASAGAATAAADIVAPPPVPPDAVSVAGASPGALDASITEFPPPSRAVPTVPSPADPEPSPTPPGAQTGPAAHSSSTLSGTAQVSARLESPSIQALLADLMHARRELTEKASELRKVVSERNTLRTRLLRAESKARELSSAFRTEAQLRSEFVDAHATSSASLRARVTELEAELASLPELELKLVDLEVKLRERDEQLRDWSAQAAQAGDSRPPSERVGLRRIRGIGPAYERALLALGITTVAQIAKMSPDEIASIAPQIKARADRILRDDWIGQARRLSDE